MGTKTNVSSRISPKVINPKKLKTQKFQTQFIFVFFLFFRFNVWALCPKGFYMNGIRTGSYPPSQSFLNNIEEARCCHPMDHPSSYADCYDEDVAISFNNKGWSECQKNGYYMTGFYKSNCHELKCIDKFRCCKHLLRRNSIDGKFWARWRIKKDVFSSCHERGMKKNSETRRKSIFLNLLRSSDAKNGNYIVVQLFLYTKRDKNKERLSWRIFNFPKLRCVRG